MTEVRSVSSHLFAGGITALVLAVVLPVVPMVIAVIELVLEQRALDLSDLVWVALVGLVAAAAYTVLVVFPTVWVLSRLTGGQGWLVVTPALVVSGLVDLVLLSRGYWVPDSTLPNWPVWVAGLAFGPAVYIYWSNFRATEKEAQSTDV